MISSIESLYTVYVRLPLGSMSSVVRPMLLTAIWVIRCRPPPVGVAQFKGKFWKSPVRVVSTSVIVFTTAPVAGS